MTQYSLTAEPWYNVTTSSLLQPQYLQYSLTAEPWWATFPSQPPSGHIKSINGVPWEHVKSYNSVLQSHIKTALGVEG